MDLPMIIRFAIIACLTLCVAAPPGYAEKRYAKEGEGIQLNQSFVSLEDGTFYGLAQKKVFQPEEFLPPSEWAENHERAIRWLNQFRYWNDGVPPRKPCVERYKERRRQHIRQRDVLGDESWFRQDFLGAAKDEKPPDKGG